MLQTTNQIHSSRILNAPLSSVYDAFANPAQLKNRWGPNGFTNKLRRLVIPNNEENFDRLEVELEKMK
jgi:uncharacterized protein YndB with AHSA1/START domain